ncbi:MAG: cyclic peptide export ABC transporter [Kiritimatiellae bacterium]|nr:cyclic peptide export ABC transporter [Kiritimatiellia bacterium]
MKRIPLINLIQSETETCKWPIVLATMVAGIANTVAIGIVNEAAHSFLADSTFNTRLLICFLLTIAVFIYTQTYSLRRAVQMIEGAVFNTRLRISDKIRQAEWSFIEGENKGEIYLKLTRDGNLISAASTTLVMAVQGVVVMVFCFMYIAWLSQLAFLILGVLTALVAFYHFGRNQLIRDDIRESEKQEIYFFGLLNHVLMGFKEIKLNDRKNDDLFACVKEVSKASKQARMKVGNKYVSHALMINLMQALLLGSISFILPVFRLGYTEIMLPLIVISLFVMGSIRVIFYSMRHFMEINESIRSLQGLEKNIDQAYCPVKKVDQKKIKRLYDFRTIDLTDLEYAYRDQEGYPLFPFGPATLSIKRGEMLFVVGGNGSGKTTFLKLLTGLYFPHEGTISVDDKAVYIRDYAPYRNLFATVFSDFYLFDQLYGIGKVEDRKVDDWLIRMQLAEKTSYEEGKFSSLSLSTGQRKRLAFIAAILEDRPICIFDELAADQDPEFRVAFYEEILPDLKRQGKTIIAVSHDDRFWHVADRVVKFEYGKQIDENL